VTAGPAADPAISRHRLGTQLRQLRLARAMQIAEAAAEVGIAPSTLSRIETGKAPARSGYIRILLDLYQVTDPAHRHALTSLATSGQHDDWHAAAGLVPAETLRYYGLESAAARIQAVATDVIPGLLQIPGYAAAAWHAACPGLTSDDAAALAGLTEQRQKAFDNGAHRLHAVIDEAVLIRPVGSAEVTAAQLDHLARAATAARLTIQVLPLAVPWPVLIPPFTILTFPDRAVPATGCSVTTDGRTAFTARPAAVAALQAAFDLLAQAALPREESADVIGRLARHALTGPPAPGPAACVA